ncbi:MAG: [NiFe]-hydrogenase assembly chaperone HybE [Zoogloea sp.]|nr:[NiFe]-hydrogenase assembly chaperone HybE [Zoogloea sp.]
MSAPATWPDNPAGAVEAVFSGIAATRMAGLPICNPALSVAAVDFVRWEGEWLGVLLTPWTISLMLLPGDGGQFRRIGVGEQQDWALPSGEYVFMGTEEPGLGHFQFCSLYSPPAQFASQDEALDFARAARAAALKFPQVPPAAIPAERPGLSRRGFLRLGRGERSA